MPSIEHPEWRQDAFGRQRQLWIAPEVQGVIDQLEAIDPRLALYLEEDPSGAARSRWVLERLGEDGEYHRVCHSKPGADLQALPGVLLAHDTQRGYDPLAETIAHNERVSEENRRAHNEKLAAAFDKVAWGWDKDTHGGSLDGSTLPKIQAWARRAMAKQ